MRTLNPEVLHEIAIETRQCFLREDAPSYLTNLQKGLAKIQSGHPDYISLMHATHSLKGGSAIAELSSLSHLAHKLEDLLEILQHNEFCDRKTIAEVLSDGIDEVASVLSQAAGLPSNALADVQIDLVLLQRFDTLLEIVKIQETNQNNNGQSANLSSELTEHEPQTTSQTELSISTNTVVQPKISPIVISSLEKDLEACLK